MPVALIFGVSVAFGLLAWGVFAAQYLWPTISKRGRADALRPILILHSFRYIGLVALIPGVAAPELTSTVFARGLAYGDLATAILALVALAALRTRVSGFLVWIFNIVGTADLLNAFYQEPHFVGGQTGNARRRIFSPYSWSPSSPSYTCSCVQAADAERDSSCVLRR